MTDPQDGRTGDAPDASPTPTPPPGFAGPGPSGPPPGFAGGYAPPTVPSVPSGYPAERAVTRPRPKPKKSKGPVILLLLVVVGALVGGYVVLSGDDGAERTSSASSTPRASPIDYGPLTEVASPTGFRWKAPKSEAELDRELASTPDSSLDRNPYERYTYGTDEQQVQISVFPMTALATEFETENATTLLALHGGTAAATDQGAEIAGKPAAVFDGTEQGERGTHPTRTVAAAVEGAFVVVHVDGLSGEIDEAELERLLGSFTFERPADPGGPTLPTDDGPAGAYRAFVDAVSGGDIGDACGMLVSTAAEQFSTRSTSCEAVLAANAGLHGVPAPGGGASTLIASEEVFGEDGSVQFSLGGPDSGDQIFLTMEGGAWKVNLFAGDHRISESPLIPDRSEVCATERKTMQAATGAYRAQHDTWPPDTAALVGPYLSRTPDTAVLQPHGAVLMIGDCA